MLGALVELLPDRLRPYAKAVAVAAVSSTGLVVVLLEWAVSGELEQGALVAAVLGLLTAGLVERVPNKTRPS